MKVLMRRRSKDPAPPQTAAPEREAEGTPVASSGQMVASVWGHRLLSLALAGCLLAGPAALALSLSSGAAPTSAAASTSAPASDRAGDEVAAGEFATRVVMAWLRSTQQDPAQLAALVVDVPISRLSRVPHAASEPTVAEIRPVSRHIWSVTVAVTLTEPKKKPLRRYFAVPVTSGDGQVSALALPSAVPGPAVMEGERSDYPEIVPTDSPIAQTLTDFLTSYTVGQGEIARFVTPGVTITQISPPLFTALTLTGAAAQSELPADAPADGQRLRVLAQATGTTSTHTSLPVTYAVTLAARAGRWEIFSVDPAPAHREDAPEEAFSATTPASSGTTTSTTS